MEWTEETISRLRSLWQEGHSTAEIGRRLSITKNAVVGKAHRLTLPARPSPIRKSAVDPDQPQAPRRSARVVQTPAVQEAGSVASLTPLVPAPACEAARARHIETAVTNVTPLRVVAVDAGRQSDFRIAARAVAGREIEPDIRREPASQELRPISQPAPRRYGQSCCWPLGDPGTKQFRFCGGAPIPGKPYCTEHAQLAYVKLRDRRDTVA